MNFDGRTLWVAEDSELDEDDSLAQLVLHEICHLAVQGLALRRVPDWGLDSTSDRDEINERGAVRLQAHLCDAWGLRRVLYPTTVVREFFESLPLGALGATGGEEPSCALARIGAERMAVGPFAPAVPEALAATARHVGHPAHRNGWPMVGAADGRTCGACVWRTRGGTCRQSSRSIRVPVGERACVRHEPALDCGACGACCRSAFGVVPVGARSSARRHVALLVEGPEGLELARCGDRCAALEGPPAGPYACAIYADRPSACRDLEIGGRHCLTARRRVGLSA